MSEKNQIFNQYRNNQWAIGLALIFLGICMQLIASYPSTTQDNTVIFEQSSEKLAKQAISLWGQAQNNTISEKAQYQLNKFAIEQIEAGQVTLWKEAHLSDYFTDNHALLLSSDNNETQYFNVIYYLNKADYFSIKNTDWSLSQSVFAPSTTATDFSLRDANTGRLCYFKAPKTIPAKWVRWLIQGLLTIGFIFIILASANVVSNTKSVSALIISLPYIAGLILLGLGMGLSNELSLFLFSLHAIILSFRFLDTRTSSSHISQASRLSNINIFGIILSISASLFVFIFGIQWFISEEIISFTTEKIFNSTKEEIIAISGILLCSIALFISHIAALQYCSNASPSEQRMKLIAYAVGVTLAWLGFALFQSDLNAWIICTCIAIYFMILDLYADQDNYNITRIILWIFITSAFLSLLLFAQQSAKTDRDTEQHLTKILQPEDFELLKTCVNLQASIQADDLDPLTSITYPFKADKTDIRYYLQNINPNYKAVSTTVDIDIYCFDNEFKSIIQDQQWQLSEFKTTIPLYKKVQGNIRYNPVNGSYLIHSRVNNDSPKSPFDFYFKLSLNEHGTQSQLTNLGVQYSNKVVYHSDASYEIPQGIAELSTGTHNFIQNEDQYLVHKTDDNTSIYTAKEVLELIKPISVFSYLFVLLSVIIGLLVILDGYFDVFPSLLKYAKKGSSLRNRIQFIIVMLIVISFVVIGLVTVLYFQRVTESHTVESLKNQLVSLSDNISFQLDDYTELDRAQRVLSENLSALASNYQSELILFNQFGQQTNSTIPFTDEKRISYELFDKSKQGLRFLFPENTIKNGEQYISGSASLSTDRLGQIGYIKLISKAHENSFANINDFLGTLLNVYVFLFLFAGALALFVANSITEPIARIGEQMRRFKLGKKNEPLEWQKEDEIGALVSEYNQMIGKLDESAEFIAKTERDFAWREMAKQVAHEIKNPLTPMKLSIQYLEKAAGRYPERANELIKNVSPTLIEQIDNLTQIANEFSNFAKIPEGRNEKVVLNEVVEAVHDLFRKRDDMDIQMNEPIDEILVHADRNHLVRILNNLVKNAIQAVPTDRHGEIYIALYIENNNAIVMVQDNGCGIPDDMKDKVFVPNFTTKSSGTGLGLAISSNMAESFNSRIYFESKVDIGTKFFLEIPLLRNSPNFVSDPNRVMLD